MPKVYVFSQSMYPDDVINSVLMSQLCSGMVERGWEVLAFPCVRRFRKPCEKYNSQEVWSGVQFERIWNPGWNQASAVGRILNAIWMIVAWSAMAFQRRHRPDILIVETNPLCSVVSALAWRYAKPRTKIVHWCFDLYPEAAFADEILNRRGSVAKVLVRLMGQAYRTCDVIVDIGQCMREALLRYGSSARKSTLTPWAQVEPAEPASIADAERESLCGAARLVLMYSGNFGRAHSLDDMLQLAHAMREDDVHLVLSLSGNRERQLREMAARNSSKIHFTAFAEAARLQTRLAAADIHIVTLREEWTGIVVPSKFFGALAIGRPVIFCGSSRSVIAQWIKEYKIGWVLTPGSGDELAQLLRNYAEDENARLAMNQRCHAVYRHVFSKKLILDEWHRELSGLVENPGVGVVLDAVAQRGETCGEKQTLSFV